MPNLNTAKEQHLSADNTEAEAKEQFIQRIIHNNATATHDIRSDKFNLEQAKQKSRNAMSAMGVNDGLQAMLVAQMLSIHELQQRTMAYANACDDLELKKYCTNTTVKLANCFVQQANILAKLQGVGGQKIIVERVEVHQGGQAVVGNIQGNMGNKDKI